MMTLKPADNCPLNGFAPCRKFDCGWFTQLRGRNPNGGADIDHYGCAVAWLPVLLIEGAQQSRQTGAAIESFRNAMVAANEESRALLAATPQPTRIQP